MSFGSERRRDLAVAALLAALAFLFFADVLCSGRNFYVRDLFTYHYPMKRIVRDLMAGGQLPLWNRFFAGGQPLAANPAYEVFYPLQWPILVGSFAFGFALHIVLHVAIALTGMYALLRRLLPARPAALFGALTYGLGGFLLGAMSTLPTFFVWCLAPLAGAALLRYLQAPYARRLVPPALILGMQLLIGDPVALIQVWALVGISVGWWIHTHRQEGAAAWPRAIRTVALLASAAAGIAAVQLLPGIDHARDSIRARGFAYQNVAEYSMPPIRPLELVIPHLFGRVDPAQQALWGARAFDRHAPYLLALYCGLPFAILLVTGIAVRARGWLVTVAVCAGSYLVAIGDHGPLLRLLYGVGIARSWRYPEKFACAAMFAAIVFAAGVADRFLAGDERTRAMARRVTLVIAALHAALAAFVLLPGFPSAFQSFTGFPSGETATIARRTLLGGAILAAAWLLLMLPLRRRYDSRSWQIAALALLLTELGLFSVEVAPRMPAAFFEPPAALAQAHLVPGEPLFNRDAWLPDDDHRRPSVIFNGVWFNRNTLRPYVPATWGVRTVLEADVDETALLPTHDLLDAMRAFGNSGASAWSEPFATMAAARYITVAADARADIAQAGGDRARSRPVTIREIPSHGLYWFPRTLIRARSGEELFTALSRKPRLLETAFVPFAPFPLAPAHVLRVEEQSSAAIIDVDAAGPTLLVAAVTRHKYWEASVDGLPAEIAPADIAFQAIPIPAGRHRVELRYRNPLITAGAAISAATLLLLLMMAMRRPPFERS
ncbi:MAG: hypothetical protein JWN02_2577 [Acidobacteria bacterium]|nr:hypothetical protein [Acidobacteriota bacterium]